MIRKIAALMVAALATLMVPFTSPAHAYGNKLPTAVHIKVVVAKKGEPLKVQFTVTASDGSTPAGELAYTITRAAGAARSARVVARAASGSVSIAGSKTVTGQVAQAGSYVITGHFSPSNTAKYLPSSNAKRTTVNGEKGQQNNNGGGSGLPNTGGPELGWLIAGLVLAGAGAGTVAYARRRTPTAA
ncbi:MAG TPA: hypothetical protein VJ872_13500 [Nocardioides sp.]|nr:hypothetical protein [Nocardioides sp.]